MCPVRIFLAWVAAIATLASSLASQILLILANFCHTGAGSTGLAGLVAMARHLCTRWAPTIVINGVLYRAPINGRKEMGNWSYFTLQVADFPQSRSDFEGVIGIEGAASLWEISKKNTGFHRGLMKPFVPKWKRSHPFIQPFRNIK